MAVPVGSVAPPSVPASVCPASWPPPASDPELLPPSTPGPASCAPPASLPGEDAPASELEPSASAGGEELPHAPRRSGHGRSRRAGEAGEDRGSTSHAVARNADRSHYTARSRLMLQFSTSCPGVLVSSAVPRGTTIAAQVPSEPGARRG